MTRIMKTLISDAAAAALLLLAGNFLTVLPVRAAETVSQVSKSLDSEIFPLQNDAIALKNKGQFDKAIAKCDEALKKLDSLRKKAGKEASMVAETESMVRGLRGDISLAYANSLITAARQEIDEARKLRGKEQSAKVDAHCTKAAEYAAKAVQVSQTAEIRENADKLVELAKLCRQEDASLNGQYSEALRNEIARQQELILKEVDPLILEAYDLLKASQFRIADAKCITALNRLVQTCEKADRQAVKVLGKLQGISVSASLKMNKEIEIRQLQSIVREAWGKSYLFQARQEYLAAVDTMQKDRSPGPDGGLSKASGMANKALQTIVEARNRLKLTSGPLYDDLKSVEDACRALIKSAKFQNETSLATIDPISKDRPGEIRSLLHEGEIFYKNAMYDKARDSFEQVIVLDPYNERAIAMLARVYGKISKVAALRRDNELLERLNEVEWKWNQSPLPKDSDVDTESGPTEYTAERNTKVYEKLNSIIIPAIDVSGQPVSNMVTELNSMSKQYDSEGKGVNFTYSLPPGQDDRNVTLTLMNVPLGAVLKYLCMKTGLNYKVEEKAILIGSGAEFENFVTRYLPMQPTCYTNISNEIKKAGVGGAPAAEAGAGGAGAGAGAGAGGAGAADAADEGNPFAGGGGGADAGGNAADGALDAAAAQKDAPGATDDELKQYFINLGVKFGPNTRIHYDGEISKLIVTNTPEACREVAELLKEIDLPVPLVLIEAKIVEITVKDLEELGFDWTLSHINNNPQWTVATAGHTDSKNTFVPGATNMFLTGVSSAVSQHLIRHSNLSGGVTADTNVGSKIVDGLSVIPNFGPDGSWNLSLDIYAIDQSERAEVLQAPKVIAYDKKPATIKYTQKRYFPTTWNEAEVESGSGNTYLFTPPYPDLDEADEVGTSFWVLPEVNPTSSTIVLTLKPTIKDLTGWTIYSYPITAGSFSYDATMKMPEISNRSMSTKLKVYDGETVILGGILKDTEDRSQDKYPIMGDVPLLGRFFSDRSKYGVKTNLLIFVTARVMRLDGVPVKTNPDNSLFEFYR